MYRGSLFVCGAGGTIAISLSAAEKGRIVVRRSGPEFQTFCGGQASDKVERDELKG